VKSSIDFNKPVHTKHF